MGTKTRENSSVGGGANAGRKQHFSVDKQQALLEIKMLREAFFLPAANGYRFCLYTPASRVNEKGGFLYIHPFAEELNKTRRMVSLQARAMAAAGFSVLEIDLLGCGDSSGDFSDATWDAWVSDIELAYQWLRQRSSAPLWLWGLRVGCLVAAAAAPKLPEKVNLLFWQPVTAGQCMLQQFFRVAAANKMMADGSGKGVVARLKAELSAGREIELAGYRLSPSLANALDAAVLKPAIIAGVRLLWFDVATRQPSEISQVTAPRIDAWCNVGNQVIYRTVTGPAFWQTTEIEVAPELLAVTMAALDPAREF